MTLMEKQIEYDKAQGNYEEPKKEYDTRESFSSLNLGIKNKLYEDNKSAYEWLSNNKEKNYNDYMIMKGDRKSIEQLVQEMDIEKQNRIYQLFKD